MRLVGGVTSGVHTRIPAESGYFQAGIVCDHDFAGCVLAVRFGFLAGIGLESGAVFDHWGKGSEIRQSLNLNSKLPRRALQVANLPRVGCRYQNSFHAGDRQIPLVIVKRSTSANKPASDSAMPN